MDDAALELIAARRAAGLSQSQLAKLASTSQSAIARYESGAAVPMPHTLSRILQASRQQRRPSEALIEHRDEVIQILERDGATAVLVFGSVARGDDTPESDVDLLVDKLDPSAYEWLRPRAKWELEDLLGFSVDIGELGNMRASVAGRALEDAVRL